MGSLGCVANGWKFSLIPHVWFINTYFCRITLTVAPQLTWNFNFLLFIFMLAYILLCDFPFSELIFNTFGVIGKIRQNAFDLINIKIFHWGVSSDISRQNVFYCCTVSIFFLSLTTEITAICGFSVCAFDSAPYFFFLSFCCSLSCSWLHSCDISLCIVAMLVLTCYFPNLVLFY